MNQESYSTGSMVQEKQKEKWELSVHFFILKNSKEALFFSRNS